MTGPSLMTIDLSRKRLSLLKEAVPNLSRVALLTDVTDTFRERTIKAFLASAETLGISLWPVLISKPDEIEPAFDKISQDHADGIVRGTGSMLTVERARLGALSLKHRLPVMLHRGGGPTRLSDVVWPGLPRLLPPRGCLHRQNTERCKACRSSRRAANQIKAGSKSQDRKSAQLHLSANAYPQRRRDDRSVTVVMSAFGTKRTSNYWPAMSAFGGKADIGLASLNVRF
jgi:hypothetical protein